jgi:hypothetical protein
MPANYYFPFYFLGWARTQNAMLATPRKVKSGL